jgi:Ca2+-binding EF-hand superfamily protein
MLRDIDADGDGSISYVEFADLMTRTSTYADF